MSDKLWKLKTHLDIFKLSKFSFHGIVVIKHTCMGPTALSSHFPSLSHRSLSSFFFFLFIYSSSQNIFGLHCTPWPGKDVSDPLKKKSRNECQKYKLDPGMEPDFQPRGGGGQRFKGKKSWNSKVAYLVLTNNKVKYTKQPFFKTLHCNYLSKGLNVF